MKKLFYLLLAFSVLLVSLAGCSEASVGNESQTSSTAASSSESSTAETSDEPSAEKTAVNLYTIAGPTGIGMAELMQKNDAEETANHYQFNIVSNPQEIVSAIASGAADIAACPVNLASTINKKTNGGVQVLAVNTLGVLYIVTNGVEINSFADLNGQTIVAGGEGATPEYAMKYLCEAYDIEVDLQFVSDFSDAVAVLNGGECQIALLAEPSVSSARIQNSDLTVALNLTEVWREAGAEGKIEAVELAQGCVIVRKEFAESNPDAVNAFLTEYGTSVAYMSESSNLESAASLCETYGIVPKAAVAKMAIPNCNLVFITGAEMKTVMEKNLSVLYQYNPTAIGGTMPEDTFYYNAE